VADAPTGAARSADERERRTVVAVLRGGLALGTLLIVAGLVMALVRERLRAHSLGLTELPSALGAGRPSAVLLLGVLVLAVTPLLRVLALVIGFVRERDRRFAAVAAGVACLLLVGIVLGRG
jgi:uncharacterized membrane protein